MFKYGTIHGKMNVLRVISQPVRKEFISIFFIGFTNALGTLFYLISLDFANKGDVNHGILMSLPIISSIFVFMLAYKWEKEIPTVMQLI